MDYFGGDIYYLLSGSRGSRGFSRYPIISTFYQFCGLIFTLHNGKMCSLHYLLEIVFNLYKISASVFYIHNGLGQFNWKCHNGSTIFT